MARYGWSARRLVLWLVAGQSNAAGNGVAATAPLVLPGRGLEFFYNNNASLRKVKPLVEPVGLTANPPSTGSAWSAFCIAYANATGFQPVILSTAVGGTAQTVEASDFGGNDAWAVVGGLRYTNTVTQVNAALTFLSTYGDPWTFGGILWDQGGKDAIAIDDGVAGVTKALYKSDFVAMIAGFRAEFSRPSLPFIVSKLGREATADTSGWQQVRAAQEEVVADDPYTHFGFSNAVNFPAEGKMRDEFHYTQPGYDEMGTAMGTVAAGLVG